MTEKLKHIIQGLYGISESEKMMPNENARFTLNKTIECLEIALSEYEQEIQQYRAIGTVEEIQSMKDNGAFSGMELAQIASMQMKLKEYQSIGTIEEFQALKEKSVAEKIVINNIPKTSWTKATTKYTCPSCDRVISFNGLNYCSCCGQKIDWSE